MRTLLMPSTGLHLLVALHIVHDWARMPYIYAFPFVLGSVFSDYDVYPSVIIVAYDGKGDRGAMTHRNELHSIVTLAVLNVLAWAFNRIVRAMARDKNTPFVRQPTLSLLYSMFSLRKLYDGKVLAYRDSVVCVMLFNAGFVLHVLMDIFLWFVGVHIVWPFGRGISLWTRPPTFWEIIVSCAIALVFLVLVYFKLARMVMSSNKPWKRAYYAAHAGITLTFIAFVLVLAGAITPETFYVWAQSIEMFILFPIAMCVFDDYYTV